MTKTDALNQKTLARIFKAIREYDLGLHESTELCNMIRNIQADHYDELIGILEDHIDSIGRCE